MSGWRRRAVGMGLCLGLAACGSNEPPPDSCEATASCDERRGGAPETPPREDPGTPPPQNPGTPPQETPGTPPPKDPGTPQPTPVTPGATLWQQHLGGDALELAASVATTSDGQSIYTASEVSTMDYLRSAEGEGARFEVRRFSREGKLQWSTRYPLYAREGVPPNDVWGNIHLSVGPTGALYVLTDVHEGVVAVTPGPFSGLVVTQLTPSGEPRWSAQLPGTDRFLSMTASREDGVFVSVVTTYPYSDALHCAPQEGAIHRIAANGERLWRASLGVPQCEGSRAEAASLAAQPDGGVALGGTFFGEFRVGTQVFHSPVQSPFLGVMSARGEWSWIKALGDVHGWITSVGSTAKGTVVAAGILRSGSMRWGNDTVGAVPSFVLAAESSGAPRWARSLGRSEYPVIAVEPAGRLVVAGLSRDYPTPAPGSQDPTNNPQLFVRRFDLSGKFLWNRYFSRSTGPSNLFMDEFISAVPSGEGQGNTLLFGHFSHTEDFGKGPLTPNRADSVLLKIGPGSEF